MANVPSVLTESKGRDDNKSTFGHKLPKIKASSDSVRGKVYIMTESCVVVANHAMNGTRFIATSCKGHSYLSGYVIAFLAVNLLFLDRHLFLVPSESCSFTQ